MLQLVEGFDEYSASANLNVTGHISNADTTNCTWQTGLGRFGGGALQMAEGPGDVELISQGTVANSSKARTIFSVKCGTLAGPVALFHWKQSGQTPVVELGIDADEKLYITQAGDSPTVVETESVRSLQDDTYHDVEVEFLIDNSSGIAKVWVDGNLVIDFAGDTLGSGFAGANRLRPGWLGAATLIDDIVFWDDQGSDFVVENMGPHRIETLRPLAEGAAAEFTPLSGTDNSDMVDEAGFHDGDTTYNAATATPQKDSLTVDPLSSEPQSIYGVALKTWTRKSSAAGLSSLWAVGATEEQTAGISGTSYNMFRLPQGGLFDGAPWTYAEVQALEVGYACTAFTGGNTVRATKQYAEVIRSVADVAIPTPIHAFGAMVGA